MTERVRGVQLEALNPRSEKSLPGGDLSPAALLFLITGVPKLMRLEKGVGVSTAHAEVVEAFERYLASVEPDAGARRRKASRRRRKGSRSTA